ncbi:hypothetical protein AB0H77_27025 [Streptomyces sp. NPDC050844]|uniref:hypothetical protein n=1 Tax=Streptomyces sp. NPDC050844 TaxID=3155790 RepID=UPI0033F03853
MRDLFVVKRALLPKAAGLVLDRFDELVGLVVVEAHCMVGELACPDCTVVSRRVHTGTDVFSRSSLSAGAGCW